MMNWFELVQAAGINARRLDPMTVHLIAGRILNDPVIVARKLIFAEGSQIPVGSAARVVHAMSELEREQLRDRGQI